MVGTGLGDDDGTHPDAGQLVGVVGEVVIVEPGDHEYCDLEGELHGGLGEDGEGAEDPGPGHGLELHEVLLAAT